MEEKKTKLLNIDIATELQKRGYTSGRELTRHHIKSKRGTESIRAAALNLFRKFCLPQLERQVDRKRNIIDFVEIKDGEMLRFCWAIKQRTGRI